VALNGFPDRSFLISSSSMETERRVPLGIREIYSAETLQRLAKTERGRTARATLRERPRPGRPQPAEAARLAGMKPMIDRALDGDQPCGVTVEHSRIRRAGLSGAPGDAGDVGDHGTFRPECQAASGRAGVVPCPCSAAGAPARWLRSAQRRSQRPPEARGEGCAEARCRSGKRPWIGRDSERDAPPPGGAAITDPDGLRSPSRVPTVVPPGVPGRSADRSKH